MGKTKFRTCFYPQSCPTKYQTAKITVVKNIKENVNLTHSINNQSVKLLSYSSFYSYFVPSNIQKKLFSKM